MISCQIPGVSDKLVRETRYERQRTWGAHYEGSWSQ